MLGARLRQARLAAGLSLQGLADWLYRGAARRTDAIQAPRASLRDLARRSLEERHRVLRHAHIAVDPDETDAWDTTLADRIH